MWTGLRFTAGKRKAWSSLKAGMRNSLRRARKPSCHAKRFGLNGSPATTTGGHWLGYSVGRWPREFGDFVRTELSGVDGNAIQIDQKNAFHVEVILSGSPDQEFKTVDLSNELHRESAQLPDPFVEEIQQQASAAAVEIFRTADKRLAEIQKAKLSDLDPLGPRGR